MAAAFVDVSSVFIHCVDETNHSLRFVTLFWPKKVKASKLEEIHAKMVMKEGAPRAGSESSSSKKPRTSNSVSKANGSSASRTNGKSHR